MENSCVLRAVLQASAALGRPLSSKTVARLVHITERNKGWPYDRLEELFGLLVEDLDAVVLVRSKAVTDVAHGMPVIAMYRTSTGNHAEFGHAPSACGEKITALFILRRKEGRDVPDP